MITSRRRRTPRSSRRCHAEVRAERDPSGCRARHTDARSATAPGSKNALLHRISLQGTHDVAVSPAGAAIERRHRSRSRSTSAEPRNGRSTAVNVQRLRDRTLARSAIVQAHVARGASRQRHLSRSRSASATVSGDTTSRRGDVISATTMQVAASHASRSEPAERPVQYELPNVGRCAAWTADACGDTRRARMPRDRDPRAEVACHGSTRSADGRRSTGPRRHRPAPIRRPVGRSGAARRPHRRATQARRAHETPTALALDQPREHAFARVEHRRSTNTRRSLSRSSSSSAHASTSPSASCHRCRR